MIDGKKILAIIPARGGSKGLPGKNIRELSGKPLICWTIEQAKKSKYLDRIYISTDSQEIADVCASQSGMKVKELRPAELAEDTTSSADVIKYTLNHLSEQGEDYDYMILLEPTSPLRKNEDIDNIIRLAVEHPEADGVISVGEIHMEHPIATKRITNEGFIAPYIEKRTDIYQRQQMDKAYFPYGVAYLIKVDAFLRESTLYTDKIIPYKVERWQKYEVDDELDLICINEIIKCLKKRL